MADRAQAMLPFGAVLDLARAPRARHDDPSTSRAAAAGAKKLQHDHHMAILVVLEQSPQPLNAFQIADRTEQHRLVELTQVQVARRMRELLEVGLVVVDGASERGRCYRLADAPA